MNKILLSAAVASSIAATASAAYGPQGLRCFGGRMTIKPYVSVSATYDSNIDTTKHGTDDTIVSANAGATFNLLQGDRWSVNGGVWYRFHSHSKHHETNNKDSYGANLSGSWQNSDVMSRGWSLSGNFNYVHTMQADSLNSGQGRGIWRDREAFGVSGAVERRFSGVLHGNFSAAYDWMDYKRSTGYAPLYGHSTYSIGAGIGAAVTRLTDISLNGGWSHSQQKGSGVSGDSSSSYSIMAGLGSRATKRIQYSLMAGMSAANFGGHHNVNRSFSYSATAGWRVTKNWNISLAGSSFYRPSETYAENGTKNYTMSIGSSYLTMGERVTITGDISYRYEDVVYSGLGQGGDEQLVSFRLGARYTFNRWVSCYLNFATEEEWYEHGGRNDYDRYRVEAGMTFHY